MSDLISMHIDSRNVMAAMLRAPRSVATHVGRKLARGALEVAREARRVAPKAFTTLAQSIRDSRVSPFEFMVAPGVNYGRMVEEETKPGKMPNPDALIPWVQRVLGARGKEAEDKAFMIARSIARNGTKAQPYMKPTAEKMGGRVFELVDQGVTDGLHEAGLA